MKMKFTLAAAALGALCLSGTSASAMPNGLPRVEANDAINVRYVCNAWGRCWWRPNYYGAYGYYGSPRYYRVPRYGYGWHRGWHHGWRRW